MITFRPGQLAYLPDDRAGLPGRVIAVLPDGRVRVNVVGRDVVRDPAFLLPAEPDDFPHFRPGDRVEVAWRIDGQVVWKTATVRDVPPDYAPSSTLLLQFDDADPDDDSQGFREVNLLRRVVRYLHPDAPVISSKTQQDR
jgi:hypothetical protein